MSASASTAEWVSGSLPVLDELITECKQKQDDLTISDFIEFANDLFDQYLYFSKYYQNEVPLFTKAYKDSLDLAFDLLDNGLVTSKRLRTLSSYSKEINKLFKDYSKSFNETIRALKRQL